MSRRTQRATKYIFATLAQLSENFIFIYLGLSLFTSPPSSTKVTNYVKPLFITITTVAVVFTRYAAVFPLSEAINFFHRHARGQRTEELPHSYQMMLFWAGLRGAVGVALAAGFKGENAQTLKITVLVVVVLTVVVFGGTTARMLEVLGIRTGVEDDAASDSDDEDGYLPPAVGNGAWSANAARRRSGMVGNTRWGYTDDDEGFGRIVGGRSGAGRIGMHYEPRNYNHFQPQQPGSPLHNNTIFSAASSDSYDSDGGEVLPMAVASSGDHGNKRASRDMGGVGGPSGSNMVGGTPATVEEGKWFQALDERYLIPLFSNATASRTFHARKARRASGLGIGGSGLAGGGSNHGSRNGSRFGTPAGSDEDLDDGVEVDLSGVARRSSPPQMGGQEVPMPPATDERRTERGLASPMLRRDSEGQVRDRVSPPR